MKIAVNSLLSLLDVGTGFCYWLLGRDLLDEEVKQIKQLFVRGRHGSAFEFAPWVISCTSRSAKRRR